jgi:hypothetical protein
VKLVDLTPDWLKENFLFRIPIKFDNESISDDAMNFYIESAVSKAETMVGITIKKKTIENEAYDYRLEEWMSGFGFVQLNTRPAIKVSKMALNVITSIISIPPEWIQLKKKTAQVNLIPYFGVLATANISNQLLMFFPLLSSTNYVPQILQITYDVGFDDNEHLPVLLIQYIGEMACISVLNVLGEIALGGQAGLAGYSIGVDGLSQSISTTMSAENAAYGGRIRQYERGHVELVKVLRQYFYGLRVVGA